MPNDAPDFTLDQARRILDDVFAPWIKDLALAVEDIAPSALGEPGAILRMPFTSRLCRDNGVVCGQALMAFADTAMVIAMVTASGGYRPMTTVDQTTHFMRAVASADVIADARVVRMGRTMSFGRVTLTSAADGKPVAMVSSAFAML
ncbi:PaaI family thioesterase [Bradyrhizobium sp. 83002]|uniref:PaaI family thioesterase n=1 Tax=Bradyrhizobium aeschynomenes TaxID=2734909 RepID=UPI0015557CF8|nr:PaaI family thioesterase [Bradyrhizobium aeschynomenes]NPU12608.1 PaaI family thioesterase [Bradyrhizobium aeschynomenes]